MTTQQSKRNYSRLKARRVLKDKYPLLLTSRTNVVHHKDENPFNNDITNLEIMSISDHFSLHNKGIIKGIRQTTLNKIDLIFLEYNWNK